MKYKDLDSKQRANYWALSYLMDIIGGELGKENPFYMDRRRCKMAG